MDLSRNPLLTDVSRSTCIVDILKSLKLAHRTYKGWTPYEEKDLHVERLICVGVPFENEKYLL